MRPCPNVLAVLGVVSALLSASPAGAQTPPMDDALVVEMSTLLVFGDADENQAALDALAAPGDADIVPSLILAMRYSRLGEVRSRRPDRSDRRRNHRRLEWLDDLDGDHPEIAPHASYLEFKRRLYGAIDPRFGEFLYAGLPHDIRLEEIVWGGVRGRRHPGADNPRHIAGTEADYLEAGRAGLRGRYHGERPGLSAAHDGLARDVQRCDRRRAGLAGLLHPVRCRHPVRHNGGRVRRGLRLRLIGLPLPLQQADVRPANQEPVEPVHRPAGDRGAGRLGHRAVDPTGGDHQLAALARAASGHQGAGTGDRACARLPARPPLRRVLRQPRPHVSGRCCATTAWPEGPGVRRAPARRRQGLAAAGIRRRRGDQRPRRPHRSGAGRRRGNPHRTRLSP